MDEKDVIIIDETVEEDGQTPEEAARQERLNKLKKKPHNYTLGAILMKIIIVIAIFGVIFSIFFRSGGMTAVSLVVLAVCGALHYFFC